MTHKQYNELAELMRPYKLSATEAQHEPGKYTIYDDDNYPLTLPLKPAVMLVWLQGYRAGREA